MSEQAMAANEVVEESISPESQELEVTDQDTEEESGEQEAAPAKPELKAKNQKEEQNQTPIKTYKVKVNGVEKEIKLDLSKDSDVQKYLELAEGSRSRFEEAATLRKQVEGLVKELKSNPLAILKNKELGLDIKKLATQILEEELAEMELSPAEKRAREMEQKLKQYEEEKEKLTEEKRQAELEKSRVSAIKKFDEELTEALSGSKLPKSPYVIKMVSNALLEALEIRNEDGSPMYPDASVKDVLPYVEEQINNEIKSLFEAAPDEVLEAMLGKGRIDKMRRSRIEKAKKNPTPPKIQDTAKKDIEVASKEKDEKIPMSRFFSPF